MNVSWRWLQDVALGLALSPAEAAERLAMRGAPVERAVDLAAGLEDVVVGKVLSVRPHPNADRLMLCRVAGPDGEVSVVCGAPNVQADAFYPFAPVGATLPGGFKIGRRKIRGERSEGMLCSERELGLGSDHEGIMLLARGDAPLVAGSAFAETAGLDDVRMEVEVTPNRGDLLSHVGVARELHPEGHAGVVLPDLPGAEGAPPGDASRGGSDLQAPGPPGQHLRRCAESDGRSGNAGRDGEPPSALRNEDARSALPGAGGVRALRFSGDPGAPPPDAPLDVRIEDPALCSRYVAVLIRGVTVGPSPSWLANRLRAVGVRPVNNVVDATNYVMLEMGQPLHAFDLARLAGPSIAVGPARAGESITTLDGKDRDLTPDVLTIRDARGPVAVAGVMGGRDSEVSADTTDVVLECALFDPKSVRTGRRALAMSTEASFRFERGVDPASASRAAGRAARLICAVAGGDVAGPALDACPAPWTAPVVSLRPARAAQVLGVEFAPDEIAGLLGPLGYEVRPGRRSGATPGEHRDPGAATGDAGGEHGNPDAAPDAAAGEDAPLAGPGALDVRVPGHRAHDTLREADLIEELARAHGYDAFPSDLGPYRPGAVPGDPRFELEDLLRATLAAEGLSEAHTPALGPKEDGDVAVLNPASATEGFLRRDCLSGLLRRTELNMSRGVRDVRLFEIGTAFAPAGEGAPPSESARAAAVLAGAREPGHWSCAPEPFDVYDAARLLEIVAAAAYPGGRVAEAVAQGGGGDASHGGGGRGADARGPAPGSEAPSAALFEPGRVYELASATGEIVGRAGEVAAGGWDLPPWAGVLIGAEVVLPERPPRRAEATARDLPDQPASQRDVAFLAPPGTRAEQVLEAARTGGGRLVEHAEVFDVYEGDDLPPGARSVAVRLRFRARGRTLTDAEVDRAFERAVAKAKEETGVEPRS